MRLFRGAAAVGGTLAVLAAAVAPAPVQVGRDRVLPVGGGCGGGPGWEMTANDPQENYTSHPYVGNGYLSQRVPPAGMGYDATGGETGFPLNTPRYDGAFVSGLYGAGPSAQSDQPKHAIAAVPTWSTLAVVAGDQQYGPRTPKEQVSNYHQTLNVHCGLVRTSLTWTTPDGRATDLVYDVIADRAAPNVGAVRVRMTPHWNGDARVVDRIDGAGARRAHATGSQVAGGQLRVGFETDGVNARGEMVSTLRADPRARPGAAGSAQGLSASRSVGLPVRAGSTYEFSKYVGVNTALTTPDYVRAAQRASAAAARQGWDALFREHVEQWLRLWSSDIRVPGRPDLQRWLRSSNYQILSSIRDRQSSGIPPSGLSSDNYAGTIFWDTEVWIYPNLLAQHPEIARSVVDYREKTLPAARENARRIGQQGAFYPWTSADTGQLGTDCHSWDPPHCLTQNHLQSDIALAVWKYYQATGDRVWLRDHGWPMLRDLATYWAGRATPNPDGSFSINDVAGPDEYSNGVNDGVFTNAGAAITLRNAAEAARLVGRPVPPRWREVADHLRMPFDPKDGVFQQYAGYRGQRIKQADAVLLQYPLDWPMSPGTASKTLDYYSERVDPDGPAMTDAVHAIDAADLGRPGCDTNTYLDRAIRPFAKPPFAQFSESRGDQAGEGAGAPTFNFLTGAGGFEQVFVNGLTGMRQQSDGVALAPTLPPQMPQGVDLTGLHWQGRSFDVHIGPNTTSVTLIGGRPFTVRAPDGPHQVRRGAPLVLPTRRPDLAPANNMAQCEPTRSDSEEPGRYAEAAVDGDAATSWVLRGAHGSMTADLGATRQISEIDPKWTRPRPSSVRLSTSVDGQHFQPAGSRIPGGRAARFVRVELTGPQNEPHTGLEELQVR